MAVRRAARHAPPQYERQYYYPPPPMQYYRDPPRPPTIDRFLNMLVWMLVIGLGLFTAYLLITPGSAPQPMKLSAPAPAAHTTGGGDTGAVSAPHVSDADYNATQEAAAPAAIQAQPQSAPAVQAPAGVDTQGQPIPTAFIAIPTAIPVEQVTVQPDLSQPIVYAPGSDVRVTPEPTLIYPTPLPAALAAPDVGDGGRCVSAERGGKTYQVCQDWKYTPAEAASLADYIRTGLVQGTEVQK